MTYTADQLAGNAPIFEAETAGSGTARVRVVADVVGGDVWLNVLTEGNGHLSREGMLGVMGDIERAVHAGDRFAAWAGEQEGAAA